MQGVNMGLWEDDTLVAMFCDCVRVTRSDEREQDVRLNAMEVAAQIATEYEIRTGIKLTSKAVS